MYSPPCSTLGRSTSRAAVRRSTASAQPPVAHKASAKLPMTWSVAVAVAPNVSAADSIVRATRSPSAYWPVPFTSKSTSSMRDISSS